MASEILSEIVLLPNDQRIQFRSTQRMVDMKTIVDTLEERVTKLEEALTATLVIIEKGWRHKGSKGDAFDRGILEIYETINPPISATDNGEALPAG